jgi:hypothetical protein
VYKPIMVACRSRWPRWGRNAGADEVVVDAGAFHVLYFGFAVELIGSMFRRS